MDEQQQSLETLRDIKRMMERSSRFISLSGLSGIAAGLCALAGAWAAHSKISKWQPSYGIYGGELPLIADLLWIAAFTFMAAFVLAFLFTYLRSRKKNIPLFGPTTWRLMWNTVIPLAVGGIFMLKLLQAGQYDMIAPGCLLFYGLALVNASKYTLGEIRYLGYGQLLLGIINLWYSGWGLVIWAIGFGLLHIIYGVAMWWKYERNDADTVAVGAA
jgi:hypothetical protein